MRKNGWQLPYHPLQVVAVAVFLALGFAFYVFFAPFVGKKMFQYIVMGIYTPLITCVVGLYIWCAAADPADPGVFRSKKYLRIPEDGKLARSKDSKLGGESTSSMQDGSVVTVGGKPLDKDALGTDATLQDPSNEIEKKNSSSEHLSCLLLLCSPCAFFCNCSSANEESSQQQMSEDGMFYCSLCEVEVFKYSKHCRVCDKCVDRFDHHCRWLNNCIGKRNYRQFFTLMVSALLLLILQWSTGILVLIFCFLERKRFSLDISTKLGSSFSLVPFVIVVAICTILAMIATLPLAQLFFFHILLIKKGISTYDYIIALREQEQELQGVGGQQSPQMSPASSLTGLSSASSFSTFHRGAWCTPPRLFLEDQFDVVPPETASVSSYGKKMVGDEPMKKKNPGAVKISPWTLARLNAEEVSKAAAEARKKSKILHPVVRREAPFGLERDSSFGSSGRRMFPRLDSNKRRATKRVRLPADLPLEPLMNISAKAAEKGFTGTSSLAPLQLEARSAFQTSRAMSSSAELQDDKNEAGEEILDKSTGTELLDEESKDPAEQENQQLDFESEREEGELITDADLEGGVSHMIGSPEIGEGQSEPAGALAASPARVDDINVVTAPAESEAAPDVLNDEKSDGDRVEEVASTASASSLEPDVSKQAGPAVTTEAEETKHASPVGNPSTLVNLSERAKERSAIRQAGARALTPTVGRGRGRAVVRGRGVRGGRTGRGGRGQSSGQQ